MTASGLISYSTFRSDSTFQMGIFVGRILNGGSSRAPLFTDLLIKNGIAISMNGKGACRDNVFVERL